MARKLIVEIIGDASQLEKQLRAASRSTEKFNQRLSRTASNIAKAGIFAGAAAGITGLAVALRAGISEFSESTKVAAQTNAAIKATGGVANVTAKQIDALATAQMNLTGVDDELVKSGANLLLTFKKVRNELGKGNDVFTRATKLALDLSRAGFGAVESTAKLLGKALNDPVRGLTALGRAGVTFTAQQKETIKRLAETGRALLAQKIILREVESQVGGSARAYGKTLPGQIRILRENLNNVAGDLVARYAPAFQEAVRQAVRWIQNLENQRRVIDSVANVIDKLVAITRTLIGVTRTAARAAQTLSDAVGGAKNAVYLLGGAFVALKALSIAAAIERVALSTAAVGTAATASAGKVAILRARLAALVLNPYTVVIAITAIGAEIVAQKIKALQQMAIDAAEAPLPKGEGVETSLVPALAREIAALRAAGVRAGTILKQLRERLGGSLKADDIIAEAFALSTGVDQKLTARIATQVEEKVAAVPKAVRKTAEETGKKVAKAFKLGLESGVTKAGGLGRPDIPGAASGSGRFGAELAAFNLRRQFLALGLTGEGDELAPARKALRAQALKLGDALKGTFLDTGKTRSVMAGIRKVLSGQLGALSREMRLKVKELLDDLAGQLGESGPLTRASQVSSRKLAETLKQNLGLDIQGFRQLRQNIAGAGIVTGGLQPRLAGSAGLLPQNAGGTMTVTINVHGSDDPRQVARKVVEEIKKVDRRKAKQVRGRQLP